MIDGSRRLFVVAAIIAAILGVWAAQRRAARPSTLEPPGFSGCSRSAATRLEAPPAAVRQCDIRLPEDMEAESDRPGNGLGRAARPRRTIRGYLT
jgi:hypothetical protein